VRCCVHDSVPSLRCLCLAESRLQLAQATSDGLITHYALLVCGAGAILTPLLANMSANSLLLQNIIDQNNLMGLDIDHAIEMPDTVVDDCEV